MSTDKGTSFGRIMLIVVFVDRVQYVDIGPGPNQHTWGAALFSKVSCGFFRLRLSHFP